MGEQMIKRCAMLAVIYSAAGWAQTAAPAVKTIEEGQKLFAEQCTACHGRDAEGTDMGPNLAATRRMRGRSLQQGRNGISQGNVSAGMPAFHLPAPQLDALATFIRSLN